MSKPVEVVPEGINGEAINGWMKDKLKQYGGNHQMVAELPFELDTSHVTDMNRMFYGYSSLTSIPEMDTSQVTNMGSMFSDCSSLTSIPEMDTSQVTNMGLSLIHI